MAKAVYVGVDSKARKMKKAYIGIGGTANSVNGLTFTAQTTDPGAGSSLATNKVLIVYA